MFSSNTSAANGAANYIEDVFSTYLYTGNGSTQTITNGIDLSTKGGLVWTKRRSTADYHALFDTARTINYALYTNTTSAQTLENNSISSYNTTGYSFGSGPALNSNGNTYASWTFRKQPKFFDVVTFTSNSSGGATFSHNLGATPAFVIVKCTSTTENWWAWSDTFTSTQFITLNLTNAKQTGTAAITVSSTQVTLGNGWLTNNNASYVAYLFASNAGGFGLTGTDNVISCGSLTMDGSGNPASVTLGYEPQMVIVKRTDSTSNWYIEDNMRGLPITGNGAQLYANTSGAEAAQNIAYPNATGFTWNIGIPSATYIYIAIRRGPMKVPTSGTSVFEPVANTTTYTTPNVIGSLNADWFFGRKITVDTNWFQSSKLSPKTMPFNSTSSEDATQYVTFTNTGVKWISTWDSTATTYRSYLFKRAPSFMDVVCYTGTGSARTINHNLGVAPELMIVKSRSGAGQNWHIYHSALGNNANLYLASTLGINNPSGDWNTTSPTSTVFTVGSAGYDVNNSGATYVAYLFATCAGVSKVFSYTGNGSSQTINCGFTGGARFILIKRTDSTGDWYVWDTARGIVSANDPHLSLNTTAAEVTTDDTIDTDSTGFVVNQVSATNVNVSSATYIGIAIA
jgi:hypothetical protein